MWIVWKIDFIATLVRFLLPHCCSCRDFPHCRYRNVLVPDSISNRNTPATSREWTLIFYHIKSQQAYHFREIKPKHNLFTALIKILPSTFESFDLRWNISYLRLLSTSAIFELLHPLLNNHIKYVLMLGTYFVSSKGRPQLKKNVFFRALPE